MNIFSRKQENTVMNRTKISGEWVDSVVDKAVEEHGAQLKELKSANSPLKLYLYEKKYNEFKGSSIRIDGELKEDPEARNRYPELGYLNPKMIDKKTCDFTNSGFIKYPETVLEAIEKYVEDLEKVAEAGQDFKEIKHKAALYGVEVCRKALKGEDCGYELSAKVIDLTTSWFLGFLNENPYENNAIYNTRLAAQLYMEKKLIPQLQDK